ncbi:MAG: NAD(P)H-hydrate epimerase [Planctomycetota bacterium]
MNPNEPGRERIEDETDAAPNAGGTDDGMGDGFEGGFGLTHGVRVYSRDELREIDRACVEEFGLSTLVLMEHAASQLSEAAVRLLSIFDGSSVLVACGPGNNGGDGLAAARHLDAMGFDVVVLLAGPGSALEGDAAVQFEVCQKAQIAMVELDPEDGPEQVHGVIASVFEGERPAVAVDAVFGTGLSREPTGVSAALIAALSGLGAAGSAVVAADLPSGMDADTGAALGACVAADLTVSFAGLKRGFLTLGAQAFLGEVVVAPIGAPGVVLERFGEAIEPDWAERFARDSGKDGGPLDAAPSDGSRGAVGP